MARRSAARSVESGVSECHRCLSLARKVNSNLQTVFRKHRLKHLLEVKRTPRVLGGISGFVIDVSPTFGGLLLVHRLDWDTFRLNGYSVLTMESISHYRIFDRAANWQHRAARRLQLAPKCPMGVSLQELPVSLVSIAKRYPLLTIYVEKQNPEVCYVGSLFILMGRTFTIQELDCNAEWCGLRRFRYADVTRIDFGGGYEAALAAAASRKPNVKHRNVLHNRVACF